MESTFWAIKRAKSMHVVVPLGAIHKLHNALRGGGGSKNGKICVT